MNAEAIPMFFNYRISSGRCGLFLLADLGENYYSWHSGVSLIVQFVVLSDEIMNKT